MEMYYYQHFDFVIVTNLIGEISWVKINRILIEWRNFKGAV